MLTDDRLEYYKPTEAGAKPGEGEDVKGEIMLEGCVCGVAEELSNYKALKDRQFVFYVSHPAGIGRAYMISAESEHARMEWMAAIRSIMVKLRGGQSDIVPIEDAKDRYLSKGISDIALRQKLSIGTKPAWCVLTKNFVHTFHDQEAGKNMPPYRSIPLDRVSIVLSAATGECMIKVRLSQKQILFEAASNSYASKDAIRNFAFAILTLHDGVEKREKEWQDAHPGVEKKDRATAVTHDNHYSWIPCSSEFDDKDVYELFFERWDVDHLGAANDTRHTVHIKCFGERWAISRSFRDYEALVIRMQELFPAKVFATFPTEDDEGDDAAATGAAAAAAPVEKESARAGRGRFQSAAPAMITPTEPSPAPLPPPGDAPRRAETRRSVEMEADDEIELMGGSAPTAPTLNRTASPMPMVSTPDTNDLQTVTLTTLAAATEGPTSPERYDSDEEDLQGSKGAEGVAAATTSQTQKKQKDKKMMRRLFRRTTSDTSSGIGDYRQAFLESVFADLLGLADTCWAEPVLSFFEINSMFRAVRVGNLDFLQYLCDVKQSQVDAAATGSIYSATEHLNVRDASGRTPLMLSILLEHDKLWTFLLGEGAEPNIADTVNNDTPLHVATARGNATLVETLIGRGALRSRRNKAGLCAVHMAAAMGRGDILPVLLMGKCTDVSDLPDSTGRTPLHYTALVLGDHPVEMIIGMATLLVRRGSTLKFRDDEGATALHLAARAVALRKARPDSHPEEEDEDEQVARSALLTRWPVLPTAAVPDAVLEADIKAYMEALRALGADPCAVDAGERTAFHWAARLGLAEVVRTTPSEAIALRDAAGNTLLHTAVLAAAEGVAVPVAVSIAQILLGFSAVANTTNNEGLTALDLAVRQGCAPLVDLLLPLAAPEELCVARAGSSVLNDAQRHLDEACVERLVARGARDPPTAAVESALTHAVRTSRLGFVKILAPVTDVEQFQRVHSESLVHIAVQKSAVEILDIILERGFSPNYHATADTPHAMMFAILLNSPRMIEALIKYGATPNDAPQAMDAAAGQNAVHIGMHLVHNGWLVADTVPRKFAEEVDSLLKRPLFGASVADIMSRVYETEDVPRCVAQLVHHLEAEALATPNFLRAQGKHADVMELRAKLEDARYSRYAVDLRAYSVPVVASVLKLWLRELPEPLMTHDLYDTFAATEQLRGTANHIPALKAALQRLPLVNGRLLMFLLRFLEKVAQNAAVNELNAASLGGLFGPQLLAHRDPLHAFKAQSAGDSVRGTVLASTTIVETLITSRAQLV